MKPDLPSWDELEAMRVKFAAEHDRRVREGGAKPVMAARANGTTMVAVGSRIRASETWRTFADFLVDYVLDEVGVDWFEAERKRPAAEQHPLVQLRASFYEFTASQEVKDGMIYASPSGPAYEYLLVSYELYLLAHHMKLQESVICRLKFPKGYEGARYELFVAATCIKAGLRIEMEDESDGLRRHPEFIAQHVQTGARFAVEAKRRHRDVKVERAETRAPKVELAGLLGDAFDKNPALPYLIFLDVNLPPLEAPDGAEPADVQKQLNKTLKQIVSHESDGKDPYSALAVTNRPDLYVSATTSAPKCWAFLQAAENPRHGLLPLAVTEALLNALRHQRELPNNVFDPILESGGPPL